MKKTFHRAVCVLPLAYALAAPGCVNSRPNVPVGTTVAELRTKFGPPLYREPAEKGRQLWFYDVTFEHIRKYKETTPLTVDAFGETDGGTLNYVNEHSYESHPAALVVASDGVVIDAPDGHVNRTQ